MNIIKIIGFSGINIKFRKNDSDEYENITEGKEIFIESFEDTPSFKIDENGIGKGAILFEIIKGIKINDKIFEYNEQKVFNSELSKDKYFLLKYSKSEIESETVRIILINDKHKDTKVYFKYNYYKEPFIGLPDGHEFIKISKHSSRNLLFSNPYKKNKNLFREIDSEFYIILKSDSSIKYTYIYSQIPEIISLNHLKDISSSGEFKYKFREKSKEKKYLIYQISICNPENQVYYSLGSDNYNNIKNVIWYKI
jgi:hypothetical protein